MLTALLIVGTVACSPLSDCVPNENNPFLIDQDTGNRSVYVPPARQSTPEFPGYDLYEANNNVDTAVGLCPPTFYSNTYYCSQLEGTLHERYGVRDVDYFYFTLLTDSTITISTSSSSTVSYTFSLTSYAYNTNGHVASHTAVDLYMTSGAGNHSYSGQLSAGCYFLILAGQQQLYSDLSIPYTIDLTVIRYEVNHQSFTVGNMRCARGLGGCIWVSDLMPGGFIPSIAVGQQVAFYHHLTSGISERDYALEAMADLANGGRTKSMSIFVWDLHIRYLLFEALKVLIDECVEEQILNEAIAGQLHLEHDAINNTLSVVGVLNRAVNRIIPLNIAITVGVVIAKSVVDWIFSKIIPLYETDLSLYLGWLTALKNAMYLAGYDPNSYSDFEAYVDDFDTLEVIEIPFYYSMVSDNNLVLGETYYFDYDATFDSYQYQSFAFTDFTNQIPINPAEARHTNGKLYGLYANSTFADFSSLSSLPLVSNTQYQNPQFNSVDDISWQLDGLYTDEFHICIPNPSNPILQGEMYLNLYWGSSSTANLVIEVFNNIPVPYSSMNRVAIYGQNYVGPNCKAICFPVDLDDGPFFFRIRDNAYGPALGADIEIQLCNQIPQSYTHLHQYNDHYVWKNKYSHYAYCECGVSRTEGHAIPSNSGPGQTYCLLCGGIAWGGINPMEHGGIAGCSEGGSTLLNDGTIIVTENDIYLLYSHQIRFKEIIGERL